MSQDTLLITGASGQLGQLVLKHIASKTGAKVIAASRDPSKLNTKFETRAADFDKPETLPTAFAGVDRLLLISTDALAVPGQRLKQHQAAIAAAKAAGVKHIVYTSLPNPEPGNLISFAPDHYGTEQAIINSGLDYTLLRNNWYAENTLMALPHAIQTGQWYTSTNGGKIGYITREDAALASASALANPPAPKATFTITGAKALSHADVAALVTEVTGKPLSVVDVSDADFKAGLIAAGLPDFVADMLTSAEAAIRAGQLSAVTTDVQTLMGKAPTTFHDFLTTAKGALLA
ncbi:SDR family oxidoreductase [Asticcacaulis endophyticus]|uniref:NAD(P)-dependent oxidoreductase n=1 Tax=Asticcacaulis endophyticus TaxID=1395890 RepID=A0A918QEC9_9CAUL|nr:SDR family oxidoreductase [Asticcacaulis endophyticus]GGZ44023.1 NAD(P)-dependent oxidoreductase [Asticcacaulis endophyticus]